MHLILQSWTNGGILPRTTTRHKFPTAAKNVQRTCRECIIANFSETLDKRLTSWYTHCVRGDQNITSRIQKPSYPRSNPIRTQYPPEKK